MRSSQRPTPPPRCSITAERNRRKARSPQNPRHERTSRTNVKQWSRLLIHNNYKRNECRISDFLKCNAINYSFPIRVGQSQFLNLSMQKTAINTKSITYQTLTRNKAIDFGQLEEFQHRNKRTCHTGDKDRSQECSWNNTGEFQMVILKKSNKLVHNAMTQIRLIFTKRQIFTSCILNSSVESTNCTGTEDGRGSGSTWQARQSGYVLAGSKQKGL